jgi:hypothetical protein
VTDPDAQTAAERSARYARRGPAVALSRKITALHVLAGTIRKPDLCEDCQARAPLECHHLDYAQPLLVAFLCKPCHSARHRTTNRLAPPAGPAELPSGHPDRKAVRTMADQLAAELSRLESLLSQARPLN